MPSIADQLHTLGALMKTNLERKGVTGLTTSMGLTTLANKILDIDCQSGSDSLILLPSASIFQKDDIISIGARLSLANGDVANKTLKFSIEKTNPSKSYANYAAFSADFEQGLGYKIDKECTLKINAEFNYVYIKYGGTTTILEQYYSSLVFIFHDGKMDVYRNGVYNSGLSAQVDVLNTPVYIKSYYSPINRDGSIEVYNAPFVYESVTTDSNGFASISYTGIGAGDLTVSCKYGSLLQETYELWDTMWYDENSLPLSKYQYILSQQMIVSADIVDNYKVFSITKENSQSIFRLYVDEIITGDFEALIELKGNSTMNVGLKNSSPTVNAISTFTTSYNYAKITVNNGNLTIKGSVDGNTWNNLNISQTSNFNVNNDMFIYFGYGWGATGNLTITIKNIKVYSI